MADFDIKRNDTRPILTRQLLDGNGEPIPLGSAVEVNFIMSPEEAGPDELPTFKKPCVIDDTTLGIVSYHWVAADTATQGAFKGEFEIDFGGGNIETVPTVGYISIAIGDDLG